MSDLFPSRDALGLVAALLLSQVLLGQGDRPGQIGGFDWMVGDGEAAARLRRSGIVVVKDDVLPETRQAPRQLFDGYLSAEIPTLVTADLMLDAYCAIQGRVAVELDHGMAAALARLAKCLTRLSGRGESKLLTQIAKVINGTLGDPSVPLGTLLVGCEDLVGCLPGQAIPAPWCDADAVLGPKELLAYRRARKLLQSIRFLRDVESHRACSAILVADPSVRQCINDLTVRLQTLLGVPGPSILSEKSGGGWLMPTFATPLGTLWDSRGSQGTLMSLMENGRIDEGIVAGVVHPELWKACVSSAEAETSAVGNLCLALSRLATPDDGCASVFASPSWRLLHGNAQLAALTSCERQLYSLVSWRIRSAIGDQPCGFVVPYTPVFEALAEAANCLSEALRASKGRDGGNLTDVDVLGDVGEFSRACGVLTGIIGKQAAGRDVNESEMVFLDKIGLFAARMHGYRGDAACLPRDDHAFAIGVGIAASNRVLRVGLAKPKIVYVTINRRGEDVVHRGLIFNFVEALDGVGGAMGELRSPLGLETLQRAR